VTQPDPGPDGRSEPGRFFTEEAAQIVGAILHIAQKEGRDLGWVVDVLRSSKGKDVEAVIEEAMIDAPSEDLARALRLFLTKKKENNQPPSL
jgi:membrane-bound ClpP family serine protease